MHLGLMESIRKLVVEEFSFLEDHGYLFVKDKIENKVKLYTLQVVYLNNSIEKEITISCSINLEQKNEFFITSSIIRLPYISVNDFVSFDVYLRKDNNIITDTTVYFGDGEVDLILIRISVNSYAKLFKKFGPKLIDNNSQFPNYYPEWT